MMWTRFIGWPPSQNVFLPQLAKRVFFQPLGEFVLADPAQNTRSALAVGDDEMLRIKLIEQGDALGGDDYLFPFFQSEGRNRVHRAC